MTRAEALTRVKTVAAAVGWIVLFVVVGLVVSALLLQLVGPREGSRWWTAQIGACSVAGFGLATWLIGRVANKRSWADMGWGEPRLLLLRLARGTALGVVMAGIAVFLCLAAGARLERASTEGWLSAAAPLAVGFLLAALAEELWFRGYPLRCLADATSRWLATVLLAAAFAAAHLANPGADALATVNLALAGLWLSVAFFSRGAMPGAWGLHFGWNAGLALGVGATVSGLEFDLPGPEYAAGPWWWIDGGDFGPEGGLVGTIVFVVGIAMLVRHKWRSPREWLA